MPIVTFNLKDFTSTAWAYRNLKLQPTGSTIGISGSCLILNDPLTKTTTSGGVISASMTDGLYNCNAYGPSANTQFWIYVTGSGTLNAKDLIVSASYAGQLIQGTQTTSSLAYTASYVLQGISASYATNAKSASWAPSQGATTLYTASTYQVTSSWANKATTTFTADTASYLTGNPIELKVEVTDTLSVDWSGLKLSAGTASLSASQQTIVNSIVKTNILGAAIMIANTTDKLSFFGSASISQQTASNASTASLITATYWDTYGPADYTPDIGGVGTSTEAQFLAVLQSINNLNLRVSQLESALKNYGLLK